MKADGAPEPRRIPAEASPRPPAGMPGVDQREVNGERAAVIAFITGIIAGTFARTDGALRCLVWTPTIQDGVATLPITTASGIELEIVVRPRGVTDAPA